MVVRLLRTGFASGGPDMLAMSRGRTGERTRGSREARSWSFLLCALAFVTGCDVASAQHRDHAELVYISNEDSNDVSIVEVGSDQVVATVPAGKRPRGIRADGTGKYVYVAVSGAPKSGPGLPKSALPPDPNADGIAVLDVKRRSIERRLPSGRDPEAFALDSKRAMLLISNEETAEASAVSLGNSKVVRTIQVGSEPEGVELRPDGQVAYVTNEGDDNVVVLAMPSLERVATFATEARPRAVAFTPDGREALVTAESGGSVCVVDAQAHVPVATIRIPPPNATPGNGRPAPRPMGVVVAPDGKLAYVTTGRSGSVVVLDVSGRRVLRTIADVGARPWGIGITADGTKLYVANGPSDDVAVIDTRELRVVKRLKVGRSPWGVAVGPG